MTTDYWKRDLGTTLRPITNLYSKDVRYEGYINVTQDNNTLKIDIGNGADYVLPVGQYTIASLMKAVETVFVDLGIVGLTVTQSPVDHKITIDSSKSVFTVGYEYGTVNRLLGFNTSITTPVTTLTGDIPVDTNRFLSDLDKSVIALDPAPTLTTFTPQMFAGGYGTFTTETSTETGFYIVQGDLVTYHFSLTFEGNGNPSAAAAVKITIPHVELYNASVSIGFVSGIDYTDMLTARVNNSCVNLYNSTGGSCTPVTVSDIGTGEISGSVQYFKA